MRDRNRLIDELEQNVKRSDRPLERRLADLTVWFFRNLERIPADNVPKRVELLEVAFRVQLEVIALLLERLKKDKPQLLLPTGVKIQGDLTRFG